VPVLTAGLDSVVGHFIHIAGTNYVNISDDRRTGLARALGRIRSKLKNCSPSATKQQLVSMTAFECGVLI
jgi:hypothetical protein